MAARSPARSSAGPEVIRRPTPISAATMPARVVLPRPGRAREQQVVDGLAAPPGRLEDDREVLLELGLADELGQRAGPQADLLGHLDRVGDRIERATRDRPEITSRRSAPITGPRPAAAGRGASSAPGSSPSGSTRTASRISSAP